MPITLFSLACHGYSSYFLNICSKSPTPAQCASLDTAGLSAANNATNVINFLRGDRSYEVSVSSPKQPFRTRASVLGDIVNASPVFVGAPPFDYADSGYNTHKSDYASRTRMVYAAANDGLLHAFMADGDSSGAELWAFAPTAVLPNLYKLVDTNYANAHQYYVDGSPVVGDVYDSTNSRWPKLQYHG